MEADDDRLDWNPNYFPGLEHILTKDDVPFKESEGASMTIFDSGKGVGMGVKCVEDSYMAYQYVVNKALKYPDRQYVPTDSSNRFSYRKEQQKLRRVGYNQKRYDVIKDHVEAMAVNDSIYMITKAQQTTKQGKGASAIGAPRGFGRGAKPKVSKAALGKKAKTSAALQKPTGAKRKKNATNDAHIEKGAADGSSPVEGSGVIHLGADLWEDLEEGSVLKKTRTAAARNEIQHMTISAPHIFYPPGQTKKNSSSNFIASFSKRSKDSDIVDYHLLEEFDSFLDDYDTI
jgi:hypothetical protein